MREYHSDFKGSIPSSPLFEVLITSDDGISDQDAIKVAKHSFKPKYSQKIQNNTTRVDNTTAYEKTFTINSSKNFNSTMTLKQINIIRNGNTYRILMQAPANDINNEQNNSNLMFNTFNINRNLKISN